MKYLMVVAILVCILAGCTTTKNVSPPPTSIPKSMPVQDVEYVLISCLGSPADEPSTSAGMYLANELLHYRFGGEFIKKRYWSYEGREKGAVFAGFNNRKFYMRVKMAYDSNSINFSIIDSRNLKQSSTRIHKKAFVWLTGLESGIRSCLWEYDRLRYQRESLNKSKQQGPSGGTR